jgi:hypothetical protein
MTVLVIAKGKLLLGIIIIIIVMLKALCYKEGSIPDEVIFKFT